MIVSIINMESFSHSLHTILNLEYDTLQQHVYPTLHAAFLKVVQPTKDKDCCVLFTEELQSSNIVQNSGDLLVGFCARDHIDFDVRVSSMHVVGSYSIAKNTFVYAIDDTYVFPLLCTRFVHTYIDVKKGRREDLVLIYGLLASNTRRFVAQNGWHVGGFYLKYGMYHNEKPADDSVDVYQLPKTRTEIPRAKYMHMAKERNSVLLQKLAETTWHPERVRLWCLPYDDDFAVLMVASKEGLRRLWLDDVLLIDGFDFKYTVCTARHELRCNIDALLLMHNMRCVGAMRHITYQPGEGMHSHKDHSLEGGDMTFIVYLDDNSEGHIVFNDAGVCVVPRKNRCLIF